MDIQGEVEYPDFVECCILWRWSDLGGLGFHRVASETDDEATASFIHLTLPVRVGKTSRVDSGQYCLGVMKSLSGRG